jgi:formate dehydrogenase subunit gamma
MKADHREAAVPAASQTVVCAAPVPSRILRFLPAERLLHWALAGPFMLLYLSAGLLLLFFGEPYPRHFHDALMAAHRTFGVLLIVLPPLALVLGSADHRIHFENMREGWIWNAADLRWLLLFPKNAVNPKIELPEQGKFNAAEKLNFMMVSAFYPLYIATGIMVWMPGIPIFAYLAHYAMAVVGIPLVLGHVYMATVHPSTRVGLSGMFTGWVDRGWARHHYRRWYRQHFEPLGIVRGLAAQLTQTAYVRCNSCAQVQTFPSWTYLIEHSFQVEPLVCPSCESPIRLVRRGEEGQAAEAILDHLHTAGENAPIEDQGEDVA